MSKDSDYYAILGVTARATTAEIRKAFAALRAQFSPKERDPLNNPDFQRIHNAYEVLNDPERRATYDSLVAETASLELSVQVSASRERISVAPTPQLLYLLVDIKPPKLEARQLPLNLCLVIDRSTSMQGTRLNRIRSAVEMVVEKLTVHDNLSVVTFSDRAEVVVPAGPVTDRLAIANQLRSIQASGGTEIYQGLNTGVKEMARIDLPRHTNHLILLTDGHTYGDANECLELANRAATQGIGISAFGIGTEWNDRFLDALVGPSGGQSDFIESPAEVLSYLQKRIQGLGAVYAQNMRLSQLFPTSISLDYGFKLVPFAQPLNLKDEQIKLGDLEGRAPLSILLEVTVAPQSIETRFTLPLSFTANIPSQQMRERIFKKNVTLYVLADAPRVEPPEAIVEAVRRMNLYRMNEKAWEEVEAGRLDVATTRMRHLSTRLLEAGETQLAQQANQEIERLNSAGTMSLEGRKRLKYGTRALIDQQLPPDQHD